MNRQRRYAALLCSTLFYLAAMNAQQKTSSQESCITVQCHATYGKEKYVHGPVAVGDCSPCHQPVPKEKHRFLPIAKSEDLCVKCHEPLEKKGVVHAPVMKGECTGCHNPHQSDQQYFIRKAPIAETCARCHTEQTMKKKNVHVPLQDGDCLACHKAHVSEKPKLLNKVGNELCFECHSDIQQNLAEARHVHKPAAESCVKCHNPHASEVNSLLVKDLPEQCLDCHKEMKEHLDKISVQHAALIQDKKCVNCHSPHEAKYARQLKDEPMKLCLQCHSHPVEVTKTEKIESVKDMLEKNANWHGPIREKDCSSCHDVHGSTNFRILRKYYPKEFYTSYSQEQYELCFSCHQQSIAQEQKTSTLTGFRDGERNLHYLHINKKIKGRTCRSCHETHASAHPKHIRDAVPFGQWMLPIRYESTQNGGKCAPGCHAPKEYSRTLSSSVKVK